MELFMINFIFGPAGAGKSHRIGSLIADDIKNGKKAFLIVPEQEAVATERRMVSMLPASAQLDFEVLNFSRLANRVFRKYGGLSYNYVGEGTKAIIMWETVRELAPLLKEYADKSGEDSALAELMLGAVGELKTYSVTPGKLETAAKKLPDDSALKKKLLDISLIYASYDALLHERYEDASEDLAKLSKILSEEDFFSGYNVYIDSYSSFTPEEYRIIFKIFEQADNTVIALGCDSPQGRLIHFESIYNTAKILQEGAKTRRIECRCEILDTNLRATNEELKFLERNLWRMDDDRSTFDAELENISIIECATPFAASEAVAGDILEKVRAGARYRDFAVIGRRVSDFTGILDAVFEKHGIPYYMSKRTDIDSFPLIKLIYTAFSIKKGNWRLADVISYMRTGLCGISMSESDIFEEYASAWNICGSRYTDGYDWNMNPDGFVPELSERAKDILVSVNETKKKLTDPLCRFFSAIGSTRSAHEFNVALYEFLCELGVAKTLAELASYRESQGMRAEAAELIQLWNVVLDTLDDIDSSIADVQMDAGEYLQILHMMFDHTDIGTIPTTTDEVTVGGADMLRADRPKHVYVIGLNDGVFPSPVSDNGIFSDSDKRKLEEFGIELSASVSTNSSEELFYCYRAMSAASHTLTLLYWSFGSDAKPARASMALERVRKLFPNLQTKKYAAGETLAFIASKEGAFDYIFACTDKEMRYALYKYFSEDEDYRELLGAFDTPISQKECTVSPENAEKIFGKNMRLSQSRIDSFVQCPFSYYCNYVLRLRENRRAEFRYNDIGTFVHEILERFLRETRREDGSFNTGLSDSEIASVADQLISDYISKLCSGEAMMSNRLKNLFLRLRRAIILLIKNLSQEFAQSDFSPALFELEIGPTPDAIPPIVLSLDDGTRVSVVGKIDRVDTYEKDGKVYIRVVDYKTGTKDFSLDDVRKGLNIQLLLYLFTIWKAHGDVFLRKIELPCDYEILPAGVLYSSVQPPDVSLGGRKGENEVNTEAEARLTRKGLLIDDVDVLRAMEKDFAGKYIPVKLKKDGNFTASASIASLESFGEIYTELCDTIKLISSQMKSGKATAKPLEKDPKETSCRYCKMKPFCRSSVECMK